MARSTSRRSSKYPPKWFGALRKYAANAKGRHDMEAVRRSVARGRSWKEISVEELAKSLHIPMGEIREKHRLIHLIIDARKGAKLLQAALAKKIGVTQSRVAQIESGIGTANITFDVLFNILTILGYDLKIVARKAA